MPRPFKRRATRKGTTTRGGRYITVSLTEADDKRLKRAASAAGGIQGLIRRLQQGIRRNDDGTATLIVHESDTERIASYWLKTGGKPGSGGYQRMLPVESLRPYLPTIAPLFMDSAPPPLEGESWIYFKREMATGNIKIGRGQKERANELLPTDNSMGYELLLAFRETSEQKEKYWHTKFGAFRISKRREFFYPDPGLLSWIHEEAAKQKLPQQ